MDKLEFLRNQVKEEQELKNARIKATNDKKEARVLEKELRELKFENRHPLMSKTTSSLKSGTQKALKSVNKAYQQPKYKQGKLRKQVFRGTRAYKRKKYSGTEQPISYGSKNSKGSTTKKKKEKGMFDLDFGDDMGFDIGF